MLSVKNNLMAENTSRHLGRAYSSLSRSVERLSSGLRVASAKDDAAGMAVRELLRADIAVLNQATRNGNDAISMLQSAEGALGVIDEIMVRMHTLAEQASTGTYSTEQREMMNNEFQQLANEITRISATTEFNGQNLINSGTSSYDVHLGSNTASHKITMAAADMSAAGLGISAVTSNAVFSTYVSDETANWANVTTGGDLTFTFATDGAITVTLGVANHSMAAVRDAINAAASWDAAKIVTDSETGLKTLKVVGETAGAGNDVTVGVGTLVFGAGADLAQTSWTRTQGSGTGQKIDTASDAEAALTALGTAVIEKDKVRARFGYLMNRLESSVSVIQVQSENLLAAESRISDVDVASEMAIMTRNQVLAQAGVSMLAQANQLPQMALQLLRG